MHRYVETLPQKPNPEQMPHQSLFNPEVFFPISLGQRDSSSAHNDNSVNMRTTCWVCRCWLFCMGRVLVGMEDLEESVRKKEYIHRMKYLYRLIVSSRAGSAIFCDLFHNCLFCVRLYLALILYLDRSRSTMIYPLDLQYNLNLDTQIIHKK